MEYNENENWRGPYNMEYNENENWRGEVCAMKIWGAGKGFTGSYDDSSDYVL